jgi:hypothetical protein
MRSRELALLAAATVCGAVVSAHAIVTALAAVAHAVFGPLADASATYAVFLDGLAAIGIVLYALHGAAAVISQGEDSASAADAARTQAVRLGCPALLAVMLSLVLRLCYRIGVLGAPSSVMAVASAIIGAAAVAFFCVVAMPLVIAVMRFDEHTIARANRAREDIERLALPLEFAAQPRWALTICGVAIVLLALVLFDRVRGPDGTMAFAVLAMCNARAVATYGMVMAVLAITWRMSKSWRGALACTAADVFAATLGAWLSLHAGLVPGLDFPLGGGSAIRAWDLVTAGLAVVAGQMLGLIAQSGRESITARSGVALCTGLAWLICCAATPGALLPLTGTAAALVLLPCLRVALDTLLPRYRSVEEVFGRK